jgi:NAD(P)H-dependent FMN reductase
MLLSDKKISILAISGSIRQKSSNTNILRAIATIVPENISYKIYDDIDKFPHFNPDTEEGNTYVADFRKQLKDVDAVIICTPEYAFGIPGVLKNALDWVVSSGELNEKPIAAISASPMYSGGDKAMASLLLTLKALGTKFTEKSSISIPAITKKINEQGEIMDTETLTQLKLLIDELINVVT